MNVTVEREALLRVLSRMQGVVDKRHTMAVLTNARIEAGDNTLSFIATDLEVSLKQSCAAKVGEAGRAAASARTLFEIIRESTDDEVSIETLENQWLRVSYGKSNFKLMGINPDEHPGMPSAGGNGTRKTSLQIDAGDFGEMIRKTIFAVSSDDTRSNLAGVFLVGSSEGRLRMVATDGHRLALVDRATAGAPLAEGAILPRKGLNEVGKMLAEEAGTVTLSLVGNEAMIELGDSLLSMRLVEGSFPEYEKVVPEETPHEVTIERDALLHTLRRVSILSSERARGVRFRLGAGVLEVSTNNPDMGEASEELAVAYEGPEMEVGFNARYLLDVLAVLPEGGQLEIGLGDELSPGVIRGDDKDYCYVVMPMRI